MVMRPPWYAGPSPDGTLPVVENETWHGVDTDPSQEFGIAFEDVTFPAEDGQALRGWFVPGVTRVAAARARTPQARAAIVLVHGGGGDRRDYLRHLPLFHEAGWPVLLFDCREQGASDGQGLGVSFGVREHRDVSTAVAWLRGVKGFERVGVVGTSQGGASVILAAARDAGIDAVVAENPFATIQELLWFGAREVPAPLRWPLMQFATWRLYGTSPQPIDVVAQIAPRPLLIIHGMDDEVIEFEQSEQLFARAGEPKQLWLAPGANHTQVYDVYPAEYERRVLALFEPLRSRTAGL
jgi:dipeptidyl aminopeptidase/acylaminoacyl peptidase